MLAFRGYTGRRRRHVTAPEDVITTAVGGGRFETLHPSSADWETFWTTCGVLDVWRWESRGTLIMDGWPWQLELRHGEHALAITGNGFESYAPVGMRALLLALDALMAGRLLDPEDARVLRKRYRLVVSVGKAQPSPMSELVALGRVFDRVVHAIAGLEIGHLTLGPDRDGAELLLDAPLPPDAVSSLRAMIRDRDPRLRLVDHATGATIEL